MVDTQEAAFEWITWWQNQFSHSRGQRTAPTGFCVLGKDLDLPGVHCGAGERNSLLPKTCKVHIDPIQQTGADGLRLDRVPSMYLLGPH
jgi:hypothetical protein